MGAGARRIANPPDTGAPRKRSWQIAFALAVASFAVNFALAQCFDELRAFRQYDVFFNADAVARVRCMVANECGGRSSFAHPNLAVFVNPPLQLVAGALTLGGLSGIDEASARRFVALCVSPLASALKAPVVFYVLLGLGLTVAQAGLLAVVSVVSFSQLIFGAIPESFALSGLVIAAAYLFALRSMRTADRRLWPWVLLGVLMAGITLTNLVVVILLFAAVGLHAGERIRAVLGRVAILVGLVLLPTAALPVIFADTYQLQEVSVEGGTEYTRRWLKTHRVVDRALATPSAWAHAFAAPEPRRGKNLPAHAMGSRYPYRFVVDHRDDVFCFRHPVGFLIVLLLVAGALGYRGAPAHARWMCGASLGIVTFNWALHSVWGVDLILYSQHWHLSLLIPLAGLCLWTKLPARGASLLFVGLILAVFAQNANTTAAMLSTLRSEHRGARLDAPSEDRRP
jgi:hypothetical protein